MQDRDSPGRGYDKLVIGYHDNERSRTSRGDISETLEVALEVAKAAKRESQCVTSIQAGTAEPLRKQQLEQALGDVETAQ